MGGRRNCTGRRQAGAACRSFQAIPWRAPNHARTQASCASPQAGPVVSEEMRGRCKHPGMDRCAIPIRRMGGGRSAAPILWSACEDRAGAISAPVLRGFPSPSGRGPMNQSPRGRQPCHRQIDAQEPSRHLARDAARYARENPVLWAVLVGCQEPKSPTGGPSPWLLRPPARPPAPAPLPRSSGSPACIRSSPARCDARTGRACESPPPHARPASPL